jgi:Fic family protein
MKIPASPRRLQELIDHETANISHILGIANTPTPAGKYLHWDNLRHRKPPADLTHEQWWLGIKFARFSLSRELPMADKFGRPFSFTMPPLVIEHLHEIDSRGSGRIAMPNEVTNPQTKTRFLVRSLIEEAITSSQLEGASTTRQKAMEMFRSGRLPTDKSEQMIFNNLQGMEFIRAHQGDELTPELVKAIHVEMMSDTIRDEDLGRLQTADEKRVHVTSNKDQAILHEPPPAEQLSARLEAMCDFANGRNEKEFLHPVVRAILLHLWLAYDHPFVDGNGRTARALFYWSMLNSGYWMFEFISISSILRKASTQYAKSYLYTETDDNDATYFIVYQLQVIRSALHALENYLERKTREIQKAESILRNYEGLNYRQLALLSHALRKPDSSFTVNSHRMSHRVAYATARADLLNLVDQGLLAKKVRGGTMYFELGKIGTDLFHHN